MKPLIFFSAPLLTLILGVWLGMTSRQSEAPFESVPSVQESNGGNRSAQAAPFLPPMAIHSPKGETVQATEPALKAAHLHAIRFRAKMHAESLAVRNSLAPYQQAQVQNRIETDLRRQFEVEASVPIAARAALRAVLAPEQFDLVEETIRKDHVTALTLEIEARLSATGSQLGLSEDQKDQFFAWMAKKMDPTMQAKIPGSPVMLDDNLSLEQGLRQLMTAEQLKRLEQIPGILRHIQNMVPKSDIHL